MVIVYVNDKNLYDTAYYIVLLSTGWSIKVGAKPQQLFRCPLTILVKLPLLEQLFLKIPVFFPLDSLQFPF